MIRTNKGIAAGTGVVALSGIAVGLVSDMNFVAALGWLAGVVAVIIADTVAGVVSVRTRL